VALIFQWLNLAGGVALILFGVAYLRKALDRLFGAKLEDWISQASRSPLKAVVNGLAVSLLAPSSTTMALLSVHAVQARQATTAQVLAMMFGACIGLTATVQLVAFKLTPYAPVIVLGGFVIAQFGRRPRLRQVGRLILGLGFIFMGVLTIQNALAPDSPSQGVLLAGLRLAERHWWSLVAVAGVLSAATQSATAIIAVMIAFASTHPVAAAHILSWVIGANLGIGLTVFATGWPRGDSRQFGVGFLFTQLLASAVALSAAPTFVAVMDLMPGGKSHLVANAHTGFNVLLAALGLALLAPLTRLLASVFAASAAAEASRYTPIGLSQKPPESLALALVQARQEILHFGRLTRENLAAAWRGIMQRDDKATDALYEERSQMEHLATEIQAFLAGLSAGEANRFRESFEPMVLSRMLAELEIIQGAVANTLARLARRLQIGELNFSAEGKVELDAYYGKTIASFDRVLEAMKANDPDLPQEVLTLNQELGREADEMRDRHLARMSHKVPGSFEISGIHLELITTLRTIHNHLAHLVRVLAQGRSGKEAGLQNAPVSQNS
jgi:phosphate:Na+ symporter